MEKTRATVVNRPAVQRSAVTPVQQNKVTQSAMPSVQTSLKVSSPSDSAEVEAVNIARRIVSMPAPAATVSGRVAAQGKVSPSIAPYSALFRSVKNKEEEKKVQRDANGRPQTGANVQAEITAATSSGKPLPLSVRQYMEPRFNANFSKVRIHTDDRAAKLNNTVSAKAFAYGNNIFFGKNRFQPETQEGKELIAHELTHTIQQGAAVQRSADTTVQHSVAPSVQRLGIGDALDYFADRANIIPGFRMFTIILGVNPINMSGVDRSPANIFRAIVEFIPGGALITQALDNHGIFERIAAWAAQQIATLGLVGSAIRAAVNQFLNSLSWRDIFDLGGVWERAKSIFTAPIDQVISLARSLASGILQLIKDAILRPIAQLAEGTRAYDLLKAVLGRDPITGDPVPQTADTLIGGFMRLIGQEEIWSNIQRANAIPRAYAWFRGALSGLMGIVTAIPGAFITAFTSLTIQDIILLPQAFAKIAGVFGSFIGNFMSWAGNTIWNLLQIIFEVVAPGAMPYVQRAAGAFRTILQNPIGFVGNLVRAGRLGFQQFAANFLTHLRAGLIGWLTGTMAGAGVYIPTGFTFLEILKLVLSVLGLTWQNIRTKLVRAVGETVVGAMETGFDIVRTLVTQGPAAAWQQILETMANLRDMVMEQVMSFVRTRIIQAAITRLLTSLNPAGAFIQAIIAIYNTIMFFVERIRQIAQVAASFIDSISAIANGVLTAAAARVERTMAGLLTLVISFLARLAGLGRVSDAVTNIINRVRAPIDRALDRIVAWIVAQARRLGRFVAQAGVPNDPNERLRLASRAAVTAARTLRGRVTEGMLNAVLRGVSIRYGLTSIRPYQRAAQWRAAITINPAVDVELGISAEGAVVDANASTTPIPYRVGQQIKALYVEGMWVAEIRVLTAANINYTFLDPRKGQRSEPVDRFRARISAGEIQPYIADRRGMFMGANPSRPGPVYNRILNRYRAAGLYQSITRGSATVEQVRYPEDPSGAWYDISACDLGHKVAAVIAWNDDPHALFKTGPRSPAVRAFMEDANNYIFEPSSINRSNGARIGVPYRDPYKD